jgi:hypothetical protein
MKILTTKKRILIQIGGIGIAVAIGLTIYYILK